MEKEKVIITIPEGMTIEEFNKAFYNWGRSNIEYQKLDEFCKECLDERDTPTCVCYMEEPWHWHRMLDECPRLKAILEEIIWEDAPLISILAEMGGEEEKEEKSLEDLAIRELVVNHRYEFRALVGIHARKTGGEGG